MMDQQRFQWPALTMGVCYYPEQWPPSLWEADLGRMKDAGISTVRVGEFAWSKFEPTENVFTFDFFDGFLELAECMGMQVIFGTPTATPPAWLTEKYPEALNCTLEGVQFRHGERRHTNYNSPKYQQLSARIVEKLAEHYGNHPAIVGWQIDNEFNCAADHFYSEADSAAFRTYLRGKFGTLERLNEALGTVFWNQTYTEWKQLYVPRPTPTNSVNPHLKLEYYRFISESTNRYCKMQADILRKYVCPGVFITTNGKFWNLDNHRMTRENLDVYTYDSYPSFAFSLYRSPKTETDLNDRRSSYHLSEVRSICPHFGVMEQQSGANGSNSGMEGPAPRPGQLTLWAMQSVAHGADFVSFFRWRTSVMGTEIYWHGILDYDNRDNRKLAEVKDFHRKLSAIQPVCGAKYVAKTAILRDYDNEWDSEVDVWHRRVSEFSDNEIYTAATLRHTPMDFLYLQDQTAVDDLSKYEVLFYPHPVILTEGRVKLLEEYVRRGGTLVVGCRSGYKDETGKFIMLPQPGLLQPLTATDVRDFTFASPNEEEPFAQWGGGTIPMAVFNDILTPLPGAKVLATYGSSYYAGEAALTEHPVGDGTVLHLGSAFHRDTVAKLLDYLGVSEPCAGLITAPEGVELALRRKDGKDYLFVLNFQSQPQTITLRRPMTCLYDGSTADGSVELPAFGTAVYAV